MNMFMICGKCTRCCVADDCDRRLDDCTDICTNTEGGYECSCFPGGTLQDDNVTCQALIQGMSRTMSHGVTLWDMLIGMGGHHKLKVQLCHHVSQTKDGIELQ